MEVEVDQQQAVVIDCGSYWTRAGFSGSDRSPSSVFRSIVGRTRFSCNFFPEYLRIKPWYIGQEAIDERHNLIWRDPFGTDNLAADLDKLNDAGVIFNHIFKVLKAADLTGTASQSWMYIDGPVRHPVLLTESVSTRARGRQRVTEMMFEKFDVPSLQTASRPALCLLDAGLTSGLVVQSGDRATRVVPISEGRVIRNAVQLSEIAGCYITNTLTRNLYAEMERLAESTCTDSSEIQEEAKDRADAFLRACSFRDRIDNIKENYCYVQTLTTTSGPMREVKGRVDDAEVVVDECLVKLGDERFRCTESLFCSNSLDRLTNQEPSCTSAAASIPEMVTNSISRCADDNRELAVTFSNIVTVGGTSLLPGFDQRLRGEVCGVLAGKLGIDASQVNFISSCDRQNSAWNGGSALATRLSCTDQWVSREMYMEYGSERIDEKLLACM